MKKLIVAALAVSLSSGTMAAGYAAARNSTVAVCAGWHGVNGKALVTTYPSLAGQTAPSL